MQKAIEYPNGWSVVRDGNAVTCRNRRGDVYDKVRCDTASGAREYWRAFNAIARKAP